MAKKETNNNKSAMGSFRRFYPIQVKNMQLLHIIRPFLFYCPLPPRTSFPWTI